MQLSHLFYPLLLVLAVLCIQSVQAINGGDYSHTCTCTQFVNGNTVCSQWTCSGDFSVTDAKCFPEDAAVLVNSVTGETKKMKDLRTGDAVVGWDWSKQRMTEDRVYTFLHRRPNENAIMMQFTLTLQQEQQQLEATLDHLLFRCDGTSVLAQDLHLGDDMRAHDGACWQITHKQPVVAHGLYSPATFSGTLIVNNMVVSNYAVVHNHDHAHLSMAPLRLWRQWNLARESNANGEQEEMVGVHPYAQMLMSATGFTGVSAHDVKVVNYQAEMSGVTSH